MSSFDERTLLLYRARGADMTDTATYEIRPGTTISIPSVVSIEWVCEACGQRGPGFPPETHSSGACDSTIKYAGFIDGGGI